jgi:hypothetical protein
LQLASTDVQWMSYSQRDPNGRVFKYGSGYYRAIYADRVQFVREAVESDWFLNLVNRGLLIETSLSPLAVNGYGLVLSHRSIYFRCAPAETTFEFIRDAGLALCAINVQLLGRGLALMDAHLWNFMGGRRGRPVWVDVGSITKWSAPAHVLASQQFLGQYVLPLLVNQKEPRLNRISRLSLGSVGFTLDEAKAILGDAGVSEVPFMLPDGTIDDHRKFWSACETLLRGVDVSKPKTHWRDYYGKSRDLFAPFPTVDPASAEGMQRPHMLARIIRSCEFSSVIDFGCNEGFYTGIAARNAKSVFAVDFDEGALGNFYEMLGSSGLAADFTFAYFDLTNLDTFSTRNPIKADLVMGLALTHHLTLAQGLSFDDVAARLERYCSKSLLVEYMPNGLAPQSGEKVDLPSWYTLEGFIEAFKRHFSRVEVHTPSDERRISCLFTR